MDLIDRRRALAAALAAVALGTPADAPLAEARKAGQASRKRAEPLAVRAAEAGNAFGARLLAELAGPDAERTAVLSPYGLSAALNLLSLGADGETASTLRRALVPPGWDEERVRAAHMSIDRSLNAATRDGLAVKSASAVWLAHGHEPRPAFTKAAADMLRAKVASVDFAAPVTLDLVNRWASDATGGAIPSMLSEIDPQTELVLANAVYFKGAWANAFDPALTTPAPFTRIDGSTRDVPMMAARMRAAYGEKDGMQAVALPYAGGRFRLIVLTASDPSRSKEVWQKLGADTIPATLRKLLMSEREVNVRLPRFKVEKAVELGRTRAGLGLTDALVGPRASYGRLSSRRIGTLAVKHRALLDVDEAGTVAAATTAIIGTRSLSEPAEFSADRPFLVALVDDATKAMLFLGYITEP